MFLFCSLHSAVLIRSFVHVQLTRLNRIVSTVAVVAVTTVVNHGSDWLPLLPNLGIGAGVTRVHVTDSYIYHTVVRR
jgi:hypothetical protein